MMVILVDANTTVSGTLVNGFFVGELKTRLDKELNGRKEEIFRIDRAAMNFVGMPYPPFHSIIYRDRDVIDSVDFSCD